jgi:hypothetical protein
MIKSVDSLLLLLLFLLLVSAPQTHLETVNAINASIFSDENSVFAPNGGSELLRRSFLSSSR